MQRATHYFTNIADLAGASNQGRKGGLAHNSVLGPDLLSVLQSSVKELGSRGVGSHPVPPPQEAVDLIWQDELFEGDVLRPQPLHQVYRLAEGDVAVVIAVDE